MCLKKEFARVFRLQDEWIKLFWSLSRSGQIDLSSKSDLCDKLVKYQAVYNDFLSNLLNSDESNFLHLSHGSILNTRPFVIIEDGYSISDTNAYETVYKYPLGFKCKQ